MNESEATSILKSMVQFIRSHGDERVATITKQAEDEFTVQKENYIAEEKERLVNDYRNKLQQDEIKLRIQKSATENQRRIEKMRTVNKLVEQLYREAKVKIVQKLKSDQNTYKELLKNLIVQGLIKLMEGEVNVRCRKSDHALVKEVINKAKEEYKALMKKEVKHFANREVPIEIHLDEGRYLPEFDEKDGADSCMGGVVMHAKKGRIVCSNTLDSRLQLVYQEAIPQIRSNLFNFQKNTPATQHRADDEAAAAKHHH